MILNYAFKNTILKTFRIILGHLGEFVDFRQFRKWLIYARKNQD